jgi:hypothetical protein
LFADPAQVRAITTLDGTYQIGLYGMFLEILGFKIVHYAQNDYPWQKHFIHLGTVAAVRFEPAV